MIYTIGEFCSKQLKKFKFLKITEFIIITKRKRIQYIPTPAENLEINKQHIMMAKEVRINSQELTHNLKQANSLKTKKVQAEEDISKIKVDTLVLRAAQQ